MKKKMFNTNVWYPYQLELKGVPEVEYSLVARTGAFYYKNSLAD